jgi:hypothetical protein
MKEQIDAILAPARSAGLKVTVDKNKRYWAINVNGHAGARPDGISLAAELMQDAIKPVKPAPIPKEPEPVQVGHKEEPADLEIPRFLAPSPEATVPTDLQALVEPGETTRGTQARLWKLYLELQGKLMLNLASPEETRLHESLHKYLNWLAEADERKL